MNEIVNSGSKTAEEVLSTIKSGNPAQLVALLGLGGVILAAYTIKTIASLK